MVDHTLEINQIVELVHEYRNNYIKLHNKEPVYLILGYHWFFLFCNYVAQGINPTSNDSNPRAGTYCYEGMIIFKREMDPTFIDVASGIKNDREARGF